MTLCMGLNNVSKENLSGNLDNNMEKKITIKNQGCTECVNIFATLDLIMKNEEERCLCIYVFMYLCIYVFMYLCIYVFMYLCIYVFMYLCIYVFMYLWSRVKELMGQAASVLVILSTLDLSSQIKRFLFR
jgi:hypothetical protein